MRFTNHLNSISNTVIISGGIIVLAGVYYVIIKAGIPYQDPTPEVQFNYAVTVSTGNALMRIGVFSFFSGVILKIILFCVSRHIQNGQSK